MPSPLEHVTLSSSCPQEATLASLRGQGTDTGQQKLSPPMQPAPPRASCPHVREGCGLPGGHKD